MDIVCKNIKLKKKNVSPYEPLKLPIAICSKKIIADSDLRSRRKTIRKNCDTSWLKNDRECVQKCRLTRIWLEEKRIPKIWQVEMDIFLDTQTVHNNETFEKKTISATKVFNCTAIIASDPYLWIFHHKAIGYNYCRTLSQRNIS